MSSFADYLENKVVDYVFGSLATFTKPSRYIALFSAAPSDAGGGTELSSTGGYVRMSLPAMTVTGNSATNGASIDWTAASAAWSGTVTHIGIFDASTAGNMLAWAPLTTARTVNAGDVFRIAAGDLQIVLT